MYDGWIRDISKDELKQLLWPVIVTLIIGAGIIFMWLNSPLMREKYEADRMNAIAYLSQPYVYGNTLSESQKSAIIKRYHITDADLKIELK